MTDASKILGCFCILFQQSSAAFKKIPILFPMYFLDSSAGFKMLNSMNDHSSPYINQMSILGWFSASSPAESVY